MRSRLHPTLGFEVAAFALLTNYWMYVWRTPIPSVDDMFFATRSGLPYGQINWGHFVELIGSDITQRNGRTADLWVQLIFATGPAIPVFMVAISVLFSLVFYLASLSFVKAFSQHALGITARIVLLLGSIALPFMLIANDETMAGSTFMFMSATVGYVGGAALLLGIVGLVLRRFPKFDFRWYETVIILLLTVIAAMHHEVIALILLGLFAALVIITGVRHYKASAWVTLGGIFVISLARFAAKGLWVRSESIGPLLLMQGASPARIQVVGSIRAIAFAVEHYPSVILVFFLGLILFLHVLARHLPRASRFATWGVEGALGVLTIVLIMVSQYLESNRALDTRDVKTNTWLYYQPTTYVLAVVVILILAAIAIALLIPGMWKRVKPVLLIVAMCLGAEIIPILMGSVNPRPLFFALVVMAFGGLVLVALVTNVALESLNDKFAEEKFHAPGFRVLLGALLVASIVIGPGPIGLQSLAYHVDKNIVVWQKTLDTIDAAKADPTQTVVIQSKLIYPQYSVNYLGIKKDSIRMVRRFWDFPKSVKIVRR